QTTGPFCATDLTLQQPIRQPEPAALLRCAVPLIPRHLLLPAIVKPPPFFISYGLTFLPVTQAAPDFAFHCPPGTAGAGQIAVPGQISAFHHQRGESFTKSPRVQGNTQPCSVI